MPKFTVTWEIQVDAETHEEAARKAREIQLRPDSIADVFRVQSRTACPVSLPIDLSALDGRSVD